jgi:hypothetical protein
VPKKNNSYLNQDLQILRKLAEFGKKKAFRKTTSGYGLKEIDFDRDNIKIPRIVTRKIFQGRRDILLSQKLIREIKIKGQRKVYGITPLGIVLLCHHIKLKKHDMVRFSKILEFHLDGIFNKDKKKKFNVIEIQLESKPEDKIAKNIIKALKDIQIFEEENIHKISLSYEVANTVSIVLEKYDVFNNIVYRGMEKTYPKIEPIEDDIFFGMLSFFILGSYAHAYVIDELTIEGKILREQSKNMKEYIKNNEHVFRWFQIFQEKLVGMLEKQTEYVYRFRELT